MHMKCNIGDDIKFTFASMMQSIYEVLPLISLLANMLEILGSVHLNVFRHSFHNQKRRHFLWVTPTVGVNPSTPCYGNSTAWRQDCVLTRLLSNRRTGGSRKHLCSKCYTTGRSQIQSNRKVHRRRRRELKELSRMLKKRILSYSRRTRIL